MKHAYASEVLWKKGIKVFSGGRRILNIGYKWSHPTLVTKLKLKSDFQREYLSEQGIKKIKEIEELNRLGFKLIKYKATGEFFKKQHIAYDIVNNRYHVNEDNLLRVIPNKHYVLFDILNQCICGVGRHFSMTGRTGWIPIHSKPVKTENRRERNILSFSSLSKAKKDFKKTFSFSQTEDLFVIKEGFIGISEQGNFVTLPPPKKTDPYFQLIFGGRGMGKSYLENNLEDIFFHKFNLFCANINDVKAETHTRCLEWKPSSSFYDELNRFGEPSVPKPAVYLHPMTKEDYPRIYYQEVGFDISLPLKDLLKDENLITYNKSWEMRKSGALIAWRNLIWEKGKPRKKGLMNIQDLDEAYEIIDRMIGEVGMQEKARRVISDIFNTNLIDKASGISSKWVYEVKDRQYADSAWNVCMNCGLFPYIITSGIRGELWFALWLRYIIQDIQLFARNKSIPTQIFIDEIEELLKEKVTKDIIERSIRECRSNKLGVTMVVHNYKYLPDTIYSHSTGEAGYKFIFNTGETELINKLKKEGLTKTQAKELPHLKRFECFAMGNFLLYDMNGNSFSNEGKPIKIIRLKPPNCRHYGG